MDGSGGGPRATLRAWRERGVDGIDPLRYAVIDALARRASEHEGEARRLLEARLSTLVAEHAQRVAQRSVPGAQGDATCGARGAVGELADLLDRHAADRDGGAARAFPHMRALDGFRELWSRMRMQGQLRQALADEPEDAGPLNSGRLVHRSLTLMREASPDYLQSFLSYVETLSWLERMSNDGVLPNEEPARAAVADRRRQRTRGS